MESGSLKVRSWTRLRVHIVLPLCCAVGCAVAGEEPITSSSAAALTASPAAQFTFDVGRSGDPSVAGGGGGGGGGGAC
jgi:hypothetical protein